MSDIVKLAGSKFLCRHGLAGLSRMRQTDRFLILTYHRVLKKENVYFRPGQFMSEAAFEANLAFLRDKTNVRSFREVLRKYETDGFFDPATVVVTFDDGYIDAYTVAFPLLKRYEIPATNFLTTGPVDDRVSFWWDRLERVIAYLQKKKFCDFEKTPLK